MVDKLPEPEDEGDRKLLDDVEAHGWHVVKIMPNGDTPGWAFTVGLTHTLGHPEVVVFGLPLDTMHTILNTVGGLVREGARFEPGARSSDVLDGFDCQFQAVDEAWLGPFLGYAVWFHNGTPFSAVQCHWPDKEGKMPGDEGFDEELAPLQPLLHHTDPSEARAEDLLRAWGLLG